MSDPLPPGYLDKLAHIESGSRPYIKARTSSASGLYQLTKSTWCALGGSWGSDATMAFGGLKPTPAEQTAKARELSEASARTLRIKGLPVTPANLYCCHFLGARTGLEVLGAPGLEDLVNVVGPAAVRANRFLDDMTVSGFHRWLEERVR